MVRRTLLAALVLAGAASVHAMAASSSSIPGGERLTLLSKVLGEPRTIFVSLPESYARGAQRYPVIYVTDADSQFVHTWASAAFLARNGLMPETIVVAATNPDRTHDLYASRADYVQDGRTSHFPTSGSADLFLDFLEKELIPWTETTYRTAPLRVLAGHSAGGNFALHTMRTKPGLFQAVIAASPWLAWDDRKELKQLVPFLASADVKTRTLFFSSADEGPGMKTELDAMAAALRSRRDESLRWSAVAYPSESHDSVALKSYYDALRMIFTGWSFPRDAKSHLLSGSLDDVKTHYAQLGERLGSPLLPPEATVNELGYQQLNKGELAVSLATFRYNAELYPESANVWDSLGDALERAGKKDEALASCRKAMSLGEAYADPNLQAFTKHVARLEGVAQPTLK